MIGEGMKVRIVPHAIDSPKFTPEERIESTLTAKVVYINWEHKYFTVEWQEEMNYTFRESFKFSQIGKEVKVCG